MHETLVLLRVVRLFEERLADRPDRRSMPVRIWVSPWFHLCGRDERTLKDTFAMVVAGTCAEGVVLEINKTSVLIACPTCGREQTGAEPIDARTAWVSVILFFAEEPQVCLQDIGVEEA